MTVLHPQLHTYHGIGALMHKSNLTEIN